MREGNGSLIGGLVIVLIAVGLGLYFTYGGPSAPAGGGAAAPVSFYCGAGNSFTATFATSSVALLFNDGSSANLPQTISGSGIRYEATSTGADLLFTSKGDWGSFTNAASTTDVRYSACTAARVSEGAGGMNTYEDQSKTFTFTFPSTFQVAGIENGYVPDWTAPGTGTGLMLAKVYVPGSFEPGTNFGDAWFTVGVSSDPTQVADCTNTLAGSAATSTPITIGDTTYTKLLFGGAGAGNRYDTTSYRTVKDNMCYAVEYTVHYGVLENYPKGMVQAFDEQKITDALDKIAQSFRFE